MNGEFLVNYEPIGHLPTSIRNHETYKRFFGDLNLPVKPSSMGLGAYVFMADAALPDHTSFTFFLCRGDLVVVEQTSRRTVRQLIPHTAFAAKFPAHFVDEHSHWLDKSGSGRGRMVVEFCALNYTEYIKSGGKANYALDLGDDMTLRERPPLAGRLLVDIASPTFDELATKITDRLDERAFVHVFVDEKRNDRLAIHLTRLNLSFSVDTRSLHVISNEYLNMRVSDSQLRDTLIGLRKCVLLCDVDWVDDEHSARLLLVLNGTLDIGSSTITTKNRTHVEKYVNVNYEPSRYCRKLYIWQDLIIKGPKKRSFEILHCLRWERNSYKK